MAIHRLAPAVPPPHALDISDEALQIESSVIINADAGMAYVISSLETFSVGANALNQPLIVPTIAFLPESLQTHTQSASLAIPLDYSEAIFDGLIRSEASGADAKSKVRGPRLKPLQRDSLTRREALLRGKEGSHRRRRWENAHLLNNKHLVPPLPSDWEIRPAYFDSGPFPYHLAALWDEGAPARAAKEREDERRRAARNQGVDNVWRIPRDLRRKLNRKQGSINLFRDLETQIRDLIDTWTESNSEGKLEAGLEMISLDDSEDEEIVFIGRYRRPGAPLTAIDAAEPNLEKRQLAKEKLILDRPLNDRRAALGRWIVQVIAKYYGLSSRSIAVGDPARSETYVAIREKKASEIDTRFPCFSKELPKPLSLLL